MTRKTRRKANPDGKVFFYLHARSDLQGFRVVPICVQQTLLCCCCLLGFYAARASARKNSSAFWLIWPVFFLMVNFLSSSLCISRRSSRLVVCFYFNFIEDFSSSTTARARPSFDDETWTCRRSSDDIKQVYPAFLNPFLFVCSSC